MKPFVRGKRVSTILCMACLAGVSGTLDADTAPAGARGATRTLKGIRGVATNHAVVNMKALAEKEAMTPPGAARVPVAVHPPMPRPPRAAPVPTAHAGAPPATAVPSLPAPEVPSPAPAASFQALLDNNAVIPPDTHGAVGPNHVMTVLNSQVRIQDKTGGIVSTVLLNNFWSSVNGGSGAFDTKAFYDPYGGRWVFVACDDAGSATSGFLVGASQTSDPTGNWNLYKVDVDATNTVWADYPSIGFNKDWVVVQLNMFTVSTNSYVRGEVFVLNKANLYAGTGASFTRFQDNTLFSAVPAFTYDGTLSTEYMLESYNEPAGRLRLWQITGAVGSEALGTVGFPTGTAWVWSSATPDFAPQLGSVQKISTNDSRMQNVVYRNGQLWAAQTIFLPAGGTPTRASVQWWQITTGGAVTQQGRLDDGTGATFYAFPTIAVNKDGDALVGYSRYSATQYASGNYAFRAAGDGANTFRDDTVLKVGEAPYYKTYGGGENRWGDYSSTVVDPANDTDFWTIQEYAATPGGGFDRWGTWWGKIVPPATVNTAPSITAAGPLSRQQGSPGGSSTIATVSDAETPAGSLVVTTTSVPAGLAVSGISNAGGTVTATVFASCAASVGANTVSLQVMDGGGLTATAGLTVNVTANTAPTLGTYPATAVPFAAGAIVSPSAAPSDNGSVQSVGAGAPGFTGTLGGNAATGAVTVGNAGPGGSYTVTVTATDNCAASSNTTFGLSVCGGGVMIAPDGRESEVTIGAGATQDFSATLSSGRSYAVEFLDTAGVPPPQSIAAFAPGDPCSASSLVYSDRSTTDPGTPAASRRIAFFAPASGLYRFSLTNQGAGSSRLSLAVRETTLFGPSWSTSGVYDTFFSFQNTTGTSLSGRLAFLDTAGATLGTVSLTLPPNQTSSTNTQSLGLVRGQTGTVRFTHDGPPGAVLAEAAIASFSVSPPYIQPVKLVPVRETR